MTDSLNQDLDGVMCCVAMCCEVADMVGKAEVTIHYLVGLPDDQNNKILELPFCADHAHLFRMGVTAFDLTTW